MNMSLTREERTCVEEYAERSKRAIRVFYVAGRNNHSLHMTGDEEARENEDHERGNHVQMEHNELCITLKASL
ncbi:unnamed protein product [Lasius platythorax]|uniref:Ribosomal protein s6 modification protein n=2 Tax=Lasius TaxID=488720 RepID=A0A0J7L218_LASNI|nr:ribosomal protein s6 modification protein [Lasius niger]